MITVGEEISGLEIRDLTAVTSFPFIVKLLTLACITTVLIILSLLTGPFLSMAPILLLGCMYAHAVELQHQCLHNTAFRQTKWNRRVGVLLGLPLLVSFSDYQDSHMRHHKLLGTPDDKEFFNYGYESLTSIRSFTLHLLMPWHYRDVFIFICKAAAGKATRPGASPRVMSRTRTEYRIMGALLLVMLGVTIGYQTMLFVKLWLIPFLVGVPVHALIELPEHIGCNTRTVDVLSNTRTIKASKFSVWYTNGNNYHVEHHWLPGVPNHKFRDLHNAVVRLGIAHLESSYVSFYWGFLKRLLKNTVQYQSGKNTP